MIMVLTTLPRGASTTQEHAEDRVLAVVRGRLRVMLESREGGAPAAWLRTSDTLAIPARTAYTVEAMQETEIYLYAEPASTRQLALWGV